MSVGKAAAVDYGDQVKTRRPRMRFAVPKIEWDRISLDSPQQSTVRRGTATRVDSAAFLLKAWTFFDRSSQ